MNGDGVAVGGSGGGREVVVYVLWGVSWTNGGGGKVTYVGGWTKCMVLKEDMGLQEVRRKVKEIIGNPRADFDANYEGYIVEVEYLSLNHIRLQFTDVPNSHILLHCARIGLSAVSTPQPCNLKCLSGRRPMFTMVNNGLQSVNLWVTVTLQSCHFDILIILDSQLLPHPHPYLACNVQRPMLTVVNHGLQVVHRWKTDRLQLLNFDILLILPSQLSAHPHPCLYVNVEVHWYSAMFTQYEAYVHRGKPWCASGAVRYSTMFTQDEAYVHHGKPWSGRGTPIEN
ncbi:hypothetical protein Cgig2_004675 [Carnegiea gigantea]|uniref:Uncharacterized protein n=1 Tax=Carnegiea gigantea TaxID=171969 RepID=A0A9Q1QA81_9CARY|nr:hypothetical protein Cgig2_004675 [Carnegiea gigantea]